MHYVDSRVVHRLDRQAISRVGVPFNHFGHEFRHHDLGVIAQLPERGSEGEPQPQPADEHSYLRCFPERSTGDFREPILGEVSAGGHELHAIGADEVCAVVTIQRDLRPIRRPCVAEPLERLHRE